MAVIDADFAVVEYGGWETRQVEPNGRAYTPVGILNHHTAPPVPYPLNKLLFKCNITITPDGSVCLLNAGYAYDSGLGDPHVLARARADQPPQSPTDTTDADRINGNPWWVDVEVQHPGDGSVLPPEQYHALLVVNAALCEWFDWNPATRLLGHREWTRRKIDPRWNGTANPMPGIRSDTQSIMEATVLTAHELEVLRKIVSELDRVGSSADAVPHVIDLVRREKATPLHAIGNDIVDADVRRQLAVVQAALRAAGAVT